MRRRGECHWAPLAVAAALLIRGAYRPAHAADAIVATAAVVPRQQVDWGRLIRGVSQRVAPTDAGRRGEIDVVGQDKLTARLVLPSALLSTDGSKLGVSFDLGDIILQYTGSGGTSFPDPTKPIPILTNPGQGTAQFYIGGTATPSATQAAGTYVATITLVITPTLF